MVAAGYTLPGSRVGARLRRVRSVLTAAAATVLNPHKASLRRLADIPLSVAGVAAIDFAAFHLAHGWGWLVLGASMFALEHMIADE